MNTRRPYLPGTIGAARVLESTFASDYHALQTSVERRGSRWSAKAYYTFGKAMEDIDYQGGGLPAVQNSNRIELERARTTNDRTHNFVMSGIWNVNYLDETKGAMARALLNGWTVSAIITMQSGQPLTIGAGQDRNFDGLTTDRADLVGDPDARFRASARGGDRGVVQPRRLRAAGRRHGRQRRPQHRGRPGRQERRLRPLPRRPARRPRAAAASSRGDEHVQLRQLEQPRHGFEQRRHLRPHPHRPRHAPRAGRRPRVVLIPKRHGGRARPVLPRFPPAPAPYGCLSSVTDFGFALLGVSSSVFSTSRQLNFLPWPRT